MNSIFHQISVIPIQIRNSAIKQEYPDSIISGNNAHKIVTFAEEDAFYCYNSTRLYL